MDAGDGERLTWNGAVCPMCQGAGIYVYHPAPPQAPYTYICAACNGHGREPS